MYMYLIDYFLSKQNNNTSFKRQDKPAVVVSSRPYYFKNCKEKDLDKKI